MSFARAYEQPLWDEPHSKPVVTPQATSLHKLHIILCTSTTCSPVSTALSAGPRHKASTSIPGRTATAPAVVTAMENPASRFHRLTPEEMADRKAQGQCFNCPEKFHHNHKCTLKGMYWIELDEDDVTGDDHG